MLPGYDVIVCMIFTSSRLMWPSVMCISRSSTQTPSLQLGVLQSSIVEPSFAPSLQQVPYWSAPFLLVSARQAYTKAEHVWPCYINTKLSIMAEPNAQFTEDLWTFKLYLKNRGPQDVPPRFLKTAEWRTVTLEWSVTRLGYLYDALTCSRMLPNSNKVCFRYTWATAEG